MNNIVKQEYWQSLYTNVQFETISRNYYLRNYIEKYIPKTTNATAIEIGCYPGRYLTLFGELGYQINGIDLNDNTNLIAEKASKAGFNVGCIEQKDFYDISDNKKYNVVASFGFIEHIVDLEDCIIRHAKIVAPNGYLVLETPNFLGWVQYTFHYLFDRVNLQKHLIKNMNPYKWKECLENNGFEFEYICCEYCGGVDFWHNGDQPKLQNFFAKIAIRLWHALKYMMPFFSKINGKAVSRSCILIAKKTN